MRVLPAVKLEKLNFFLSRLSKEYGVCGRVIEHL